MFLKLSILVVAAFLFLAPGINGQDCIPTQVMYVTITSDSVLYWEINPKETCPIDEYIVDIVGDREDEYHFRVRDTSVDVSFLKICEEWTFVVTPVAAGVVGYERHHVGHIPLPPDADLSLQNIDSLHLKPRELLLSWSLTNYTFAPCNLEYRLVIEDQETGDVHDIYLPNTWIILQNLSPCVSYEMSVRAINRAQPTIEGPKKSLYHDMPPHAEVPPTVNNIELSATSADLSFNLERFDHNRCPVRTLFVESGNNFNISIPLTNTEGERRPVEVNLKGLRPDTMYLLRVAVENSGGVSPPAQIAVQTLPLEPDRQYVDEVSPAFS